MSALLSLSEDRIAREIERWQQINADEERWRRAWRRRCLLLGLRCGATYIAGGVLAWGSLGMTGDWAQIDRKSTRLNSSHLGISYAVFCLKKNTNCTACKH